MGLAIEHADSLYEATLTSFSTVAQGIGHINEESGFGIVAHNLSHASKPHFHDYVEITHMLSGTVMFWVEGETECVGEGGTMVIRPGVRHVISPVLQDAATCPLETDILVRFVKARTGKTLGALINEARLRQASALLLKSNDTVAQIGKTVGFQSPSYFHKRFQECYGLTPKQYRDAFPKYLPEE